MNRAAHAAWRAHDWLDTAKGEIRRGRIKTAQAFIKGARYWWSVFRESVCRADISVAARRVAGEDGAVRWVACIHVKGTRTPLTLRFSLKTYAHRQSADRAAKKIVIC